MAAFERGPDQAKETLGFRLDQCAELVSMPASTPHELPMHDAWHGASSAGPRANSSGFDTPLQGWRLKLPPFRVCFEFFLQIVKRMYY